MLNDVVNKMTFDFTFPTEVAARSIRDEILNYKAHQFSSIMSEILTEKMDDAFLWKINKLEINLGNVSLQDIGSNEVLHKFKELFAESIEERRRDLQKEPGPESGTFPVSKTNIDIIKEFLLSGDLPWWVSKNNFPGMDKTLRTVIAGNRNELESFLVKHKNRPDIINRLTSFCSRETISRLNELVPGINAISTTDTFELKGDSSRQQKLSFTHFQKFKVSNKRITSSDQNLKWLMIDRLIREASKFLLPGIKISGLFTRAEIETLQLVFRNNEAGENEQGAALQILQKLNIFQLEFLSFIAQLSDKKAESLQPRLEEDNDSKRTSQSGVLFYLANKLEINDTKFAEEIFESVSEEHIENLQNLFRQYEKHSAIKKKMVSLIIEHPYFLKYKLLNLFSNFSFEMTGDMTAPVYSAGIQQVLTESQSALQIFFSGLTKKQSLIFKDTFSARAFPSPAAKKTLTQVLSRLPDQCLQIIARLTQLKEDEIESVAPESLAGLPVSPDMKKTIIENAGLCLFAPYLPAFFNRLGFTESGKFITRSHAHRALYLLQYIVNGRQRNYEYVLQLNKLLVGLKINEPVSRYKRLTQTERSEADDLISSVIGHWPALGSTSPDGLRRSFLHRKGILTEQERSWVLLVEKTAYDLLLDSIPWSFNLVKLPWMNKMIQVEW